MGPLLLLLGCSPEPSETEPTDGRDTTPAFDPTGDTAFVPPEVDYFEPLYVYAAAWFGWDQQTATGGSYLWTTGAVIAPQISVTLYTADFLLDGDHATGACAVTLVYDPTNGPLVPETWTFTRGATEHAHLGLRLPAGTFTVQDQPDPDRGLLGCSRHEFDPERFPSGLFSSLRERDWGVGFGTLDAELVAQVASDDAYQGTNTLLDDGLLAGGSMLTRGEPPYDARWFARGFALDGEGRILTDVPLTAEQMRPTPAPPGDTGGSGPALPETGAYTVFPPNWVSFSGFW